MRSHDWASTPLGPVERWPQSLRSAVSILLPSKAQIVLFWGPELVTLYNDAYRPVFGAKHPRALGLPAREAWSEIWDHTLSELFYGVLRTGEAFWARDHLFILERNGYPEETYFDVSYDPVRDESGEVGGVFCIVSETTGRVVGERRLKSLRDLTEATANARSPEEACASSIHALAGVHDIPFALLYLDGLDERTPPLVCGTPGTEAMTGRRDAPWTAAPDVAELRLVSLRGQDGVVPTGVWPEAPQQAAVIGIPGTGGGRVGTLVAGLNPYRLLDEDYGGFLQLVVRQIASSIASARAYDAERRRAETLAQLDQAKTAFFSNVSHEFRTPLTLMLGPLEDTLAHSQELPAEDRERLDVVHRNSLRLLKLVNTLLDFSRIEAGRIESSYEPTGLAHFTADLASAFRSVIESAGIKFTVDCQPIGEPVYIDRQLWEKIVFNLLSNAFKFTERGEIEVRLKRRGQHATLIIRDTGTGIPAEALPRLFERFYRVKGSRGRSFEGSGIGLALVQELSRLHGGTVSVESVLGEGSTFTVSIPLGSAHLPPDRIGVSRSLDTTSSRAAQVEELTGWLPEAANATAQGSGKRPSAAVGRILLADDNADMRAYVRRMLAERYDVEAVENGAAALRAARERRPDLVLTDVMMPQMDGFELLRALREDEQLRTIPVILLSARAGEEARVDGISAGADDYLVKPFSAKELRARVAARLQLSQLQSRLQEDHAELAQLFAQTPVPTAVLRGPDLVFEMVNPAYTRVTGDRDLLGRPLLEAIPILEGQGFDTLLRDVMRTGVPYVGREELIRLDRHGHVEDTYWTFVYAPLRSASGQIDQVIAICNEVTAEVREREVIARSEARYRSIFEAAGVSIWEEDFSAVKTAIDALKRSGVTDFRRFLTSHPEFVRQAISQVRILDVNEASLQLFDATDKAELLRSLHTVFLPETEQIFIEELIAIAEERPVFEAETAVRTLTGKRLDVLLKLAFAGSDPELRSVLITLVDITERKRAEDAVREDARVLETLNRVGGALAAEMNLERIMQAVTDAATELTGARFGAFFRNVVDSSGESYLLYTLSGASREAFEKFGTPRNTALFAATFAGEGPVRLDDVTEDPRYGRNAPNRGMPVGHLPVRSYLAVPVRSRSGEVIGGLFLGHPDRAVFTARAERLVVGVATQAAVAIDNARLYEQSLELIGRLQDSDRHKDEFLAMLSHELRNPLAPLRNSLHLLRLSSDGAGPSEFIHEMMERQVNHLVRLVDDLLEMSRISRGSFELRREHVELSAVVKNAIETSDPLLRAAGHRLTVSVPDQPLWIDGDAVRLSQVLANLLNNAAKYTDAGGEIAITARATGKSAEVVVRDNGSGISAEALPHIFEMFSRGDRSSGRDQTGLGIGLALARLLTEMHGGSIVARSDGKGRGSEFIVRIPLSPDQSILPDPAPLIGTRIARKRILVVDDNRDSAESMRLLLEFLGADVRVAFDGKSALETFAVYEPAVVLLDIGMPGLDGYEVARRMRATSSMRTTIVALTGWGQDEDRRRALSAGFDRHLIKPADIGALQALLGSVDGADSPRSPSRAS